jgi:ABC-type branched-subunit amino acid transport system permease subunit
VIFIGVLLFRPQGCSERGMKRDLLQGSRCCARHGVARCAGPGLGRGLNFVMMALYAALLAQAWNILGGFGGQFSFGHALFFGTGAYVQAIAQLQRRPEPWLALPLAVAGRVPVVGWWWAR